MLISSFYIHTEKLLGIYLPVRLLLSKRRIISWIFFVNVAVFSSVSRPTSGGIAGKKEKVVLFKLEVIL